VCWKRAVVSGHFRALVGRHHRQPPLLGRVEARIEIGQPLLEVRAVVRPELRQFFGDRFRDALPVFRIRPVVRVAERVHVAHRTRDVSTRDLENLSGQGRVEIPLSARLNLAVSALLLERREPPDLQLAADQHQQVGSLELQDEAGFGLDEVRILVPLRNRLDRNLVAADLAADRREIFRRGYDVQLALCARL